MMIHYGKSSQGLAEIKSEFFDNNSELLAETRFQAAIYKQQPRRENCKNCDNTLSGDGFEQHGIEYIVCSCCGHLNGTHEDTDAFCKAIYIDGDGMAPNYLETDAAAIEHRLSFVYRPKRDFLFNALRQEGCSPEKMSYTELGSGAGYFLKTLSEAQVSRFAGHEVSLAQVEFARALVGEGHIHHHGLDDNLEVIAGIDSDVLVLLGVLEHVQNPREVIAAITKNKKIRYLFIVVPTFSPSVYFEAAFQDIMPRVLTGGHTHLYTDESLHWLGGEFGLERVAEWWFGTDIFDLFRSVAVTVKDQSKLARSWGEMFPGLIDDLQLVLDKKKLSSQAHIVFSVN